jgi:Flp pilus assembly protein TadD
MRVIALQTIRRMLLRAWALACLMPLAAAPPTWYRFQSGEWELCTDTGERRGEEMLKRLIESYAVLRHAAPEFAGIPGRPQRPVRVILFRSARDFSPFRRGESHRGLFLSGVERDWILAPDSGGGTLRALRHELVHLMLRHALPSPPPRWLEEGLADYYSVMETSSGSVRLGRGPESAGRGLLNEGWLDAGNLLAMRPGEDAGLDTRMTLLFYSQSWALVRWMMLEGGGAPKAATLLALLAGGRSQQAAFREVFAVTVAEALDRARLLAERLPADATPDMRAAGPAPAAAAIVREPLPPPLPDVMRVEAMLDAGRDSDAERLVRELARKHPSSAAAETLLGSIALRQGDPVRARGHLERAIALGGAGARTQFEYAMLVRDSKGPDALVEQSLRQAVAAEPGFAEAWLVLGRASDAAPCLERAAALDPQRSVAWEAWGRALLELGERPRAREAASKALLSAVTPEQSEMARSLMREVETRPAQAPKPAPPVQTPAGWQPREGDARAEGRLVEIRCEDARLLFRIEVKPPAARTQAVTVLLETSKPNLVMLRGKSEGRREFVCGEQKPAPLVAAGYIAAPPPAQTAEEPPPPPAAPPKQAPAKTAKKAPAKKAAPPKPKPRPEPVAGELVWLEFR